MAASRQTTLEFRTHGGRRPGAGRKPAAGRRPHQRVRKRAPITPAQPVHVVLAVSREVGRLRRRSAYQALRRAMLTTLPRHDFRIVHISIQHNHVHLLVEADDERALARGMQGFEISAARLLNQAITRDRRLARPHRGQVFLSRYHVTVIRTPRQARHALCYVINNWRRHREDLGGGAQRRAQVDPYSSGLRFDGWRPGTVPSGAAMGGEPLPVVPASSWLLRVGWRRHGPIDPREVPGPAP